MANQLITTCSNVINLFFQVALTNLGITSSDTQRRKHPSCQVYQNKYISVYSILYHVDLIQQVFWLHCVKMLEFYQFSL